MKKVFPMIREFIEYELILKINLKLPLTCMEYNF